MSLEIETHKFNGSSFVTYTLVSGESVEFHAYKHQGFSTGTRESRLIGRVSRPLSIIEDGVPKKVWSGSIEHHPIGSNGETINIHFDRYNSQEEAFEKITAHIVRIEDYRNAIDARFAQARKEGRI
jgi:hypothetical protein